MLYVLLSMLALAPSAFAFVRTMSTSGRPLAWVSSPVSMRGNPINASGLSSVQVSTMLSGAFGSWQVGGTSISFNYSQSTGNPASSAADGVNAVYFSSNSGRNLEWGVVALTEVLYFINSGQIKEADMVFNDNQFLFTANAGDTGTVQNGKTAIYLQDVATHEAGHVLGLDHSLVNQASLIYTAFSGQYSLSGDDANAIKTIYNGGSSGGAFSGSVRGLEGGIFGAHVVAVNLLTGKVEGGALATSDGSFRLGDVPAGKYAVMMEPFGTDVSSVSSYYQNVDHRFCGGSTFRRRFFSSCDSTGGVAVLSANAGSTSGIGTLAPSCGSMGNPGGPPNSVATAKEIPNQGGAAFGTMRPGETHYYKVRSVSGALSARVMSYSLYSPIDVKVQITDMSGNAVAGSTTTDNVQAPGPGGVVNYDSLATATVGSGDYLLVITTSPSRIPASKYSAGYELLDSDGHYLVSLAVNGDIAPTGATDMSACVSVPNTPQSASFQDAPSASAQKKATSGCGSLDNGDGPLSGGMTQVLAIALFGQLLSMSVRFRRRVKAVARR